MELQQGKEKFIESWGTIGSNWGINRTMAQIHALLLISPESMSSEEIRDELKISMGNANMNVRALIDWGLVYKELKTGHRKEFFRAEKDMWEVFKKIIQQRKKKELEPLLRVVSELSAVKAQHGDKSAEEFEKTISDLQLFSSKADSMLDRLVRADSNWLFNTFFTMLK